MIDSVFRENLIKYNVLDNTSNKFDIIQVSQLDGEVSIRSDVPNSVFGYIVVTIENCQSIKVYYDNVLILDSVDSVEKMIPLVFYKNGILRISGKCGNITLKSIGAKLNFDNKNKILPDLNKVVLGNGKLRIATFNDFNGYKNQVFFDIENLDNTLFVQSVSILNQNYIGKIIKDQEVYFCTSMDNYANKIFINDIVDDIVFLEISDNNYVFIYSCNGELFLKVDDGLTSNISLPENKKPVKIISSQINDFGLNVFGLEYGDGSIDLMILDDLKIHKLLTIKGDKVKFIVDKNVMYIVSVLNYKLTISKYLIDTSKDIKNMLKLQYSKYKNNVFDCDILDNKLIYYSNGQCVGEEGVD